MYFSDFDKVFQTWQRCKVSIYLFEKQFIMLCKQASETFQTVLENTRFFSRFSISGQCSNFITPENFKKQIFSGVFRGYKIGTLARSGLIWCLVDKVSKFSKPAITCSKLTIKTLEQNISVVNFEQVKCWLGSDNMVFGSKCQG